MCPPNSRVAFSNALGSISGLPSALTVSKPSFDQPYRMKTGSGGDIQDILTPRVAEQVYEERALTL